MNVAIFTPAGMEPDARAVEQLDNCLSDERAVEGALMADHHLGYSMPIGGVVSYEDAVSPTGVGFDIACGNMAVRTNIRYDDIGGRGEGRLPQVAAGENPPKLVPNEATDISQGRELTPEGELKNEASAHAYSLPPSASVVEIMREIQQRVAFGLGRSNPEPIDHDLFDSPTWTEINAAFPGLREKAGMQLGTVGSGNHYVDLLLDQWGWLWVANHFGSRGFGHTIASGFMAKARGAEFTDRLPETEEAIVLGTGTDLGQFYVAAMELAGEYAYAGREYVIEEVLRVLGNPEVTMSVHSHHNYAWLEDGRWVVRKGATPLTDEPAFIGGSMGDISVIVRGTGDDIGALGSAPHGAGRVMSRTKAAGRFKKERVTRTNPDGTTYEKKIRVRDASTAAVDWQDERRKLTEQGVVVLGAGADEAPPVYKSLAAVLAAHANVEILHTLHPIGVVMAGDDTFDPYKD